MAKAKKKSAKKPAATALKGNSKPKTKEIVESVLQIIKDKKER